MLNDVEKYKGWLDELAVPSADKKKSSYWNLRNSILKRMQSTISVR